MFIFIKQKAPPPPCQHFNLLFSPFNPEGPSCTLPSGFDPEVLYFDASYGVNKKAGSTNGDVAVTSWQSIPGTSRLASPRLLLRGSCSLMQESIAGGRLVSAVSFDGMSCWGLLDWYLPATWSNAPNSSFTAVMITRYLDSGSKQTLLTLSCGDLIWKRGQFSIYSDTGIVSQAPVGQWNMEVLVRGPGANSVSYHRYGASDKQLDSIYFTSKPVSLYPDNLAVGKLHCTPNPDVVEYFHGELGLFLVYNRALDRDALLQLAGSFAKCYGWMLPGARSHNAVL